jgi:hypothetical protein
MSSRNQPVIVGVFADRNAAELAVDALHQAGFDRGDVGYAIRGSDAVRGGMIVDETLTKDASGAAKGAVAGGVAGGILGTIAAIAIPGVGPVLAAGILWTALGFAGGGVAVGGILGAMMGLGLSEEEAKAYEQEFNAGRAIVTVKSGPREVDARHILATHGASNVHFEPTDPKPNVNPFVPR